ncbi:hypothetical protein [Lentzea nigeriaca]|uniref:hypothetical protein n=1 Tax=Lentzea nigeriaca TaxID=1128665 RepID=UPI00195B35C2|nr:hypothetical protein [Lentzea nigeriaca]
MESSGSAAEVQEGLARAGGSASSKDGSIMVRVVLNGALTGLELTAEAMRKAPGTYQGGGRLQPAESEPHEAWRPGQSRSWKTP